MAVSALSLCGLGCATSNLESRAADLDLGLRASRSVADPWPRSPKAQCLLFHSPSVFGVEPDLTREGGSIPVTLTFQEATGKNVMLLPVGSADDGAHSQNEKLNR